MNTWMKSIASAAVLAAAVLSSAHAAPLVLDLTPGGAAFPCGPDCSNGGATFGWSFSVRKAIRIDGLGMWDARSNGLGQPSVQIGLWSSSGALLASTTVTDASTQVASANLAGEWLFESIAALTLNAGDYRIGALFLEATPLAQVDSPFTTIADVALTGGVRSGSAGTLQDPTLSFVIPIFGPTMRLADTNQVPEPLSLALVSVGLLGAVAARRRSR